MTEDHCMGIVSWAGFFPFVLIKAYYTQLHFFPNNRMTWKKSLISAHNGNNSRIMYQTSHLWKEQFSSQKTLRDVKHSKNGYYVQYKWPFFMAD
jgi:hypothetical protein